MSSDNKEDASHASTLVFAMIIVSIIWLVISGLNSQYKELEERAEQRRLKEIADDIAWRDNGCFVHYGDCYRYTKATGGKHYWCKMRSPFPGPFTDGDGIPKTPVQTCEKKTP